MLANWIKGNAAEDSDQSRGWLVGHFLGPDSGVRATTDVEVKWGVHCAGERRGQWTQGESRTTLVLLVQGSFVVELSDGEVALTRQGDYLMWGPGIEHQWRAVTDSVVVTVRWPSQATSPTTIDGQ